MNCPFCKAPDTRVVDSRSTADGSGIRRRRRCDVCGKRYSTTEKIEIDMPLVIKRDGRREDFDRHKIRSGVEKACQKRPIASSQIDQVVTNVEKNILELGEREVASTKIGEYVMAYLRLLDPVAYVRFASVYKTFQDVDEFVKDLEIDRISFAPSTSPEQLQPGDGQ